MQRGLVQRKKKIVSNKKRNLGRARTGNPKLTIERSLFLVPERCRVTMCHTSTLTLNNAGYKDANYVFRPSSIYDVDPSIGGGKFYGYEEYSKFYSQYRVYSSKIEILCTNLENEGATMFLLATNVSPGNNVADLSPYFAHPKARYLALGNYTANSTGKLTAYCTTQAISGVDTFSGDQYTSDFGGNPSNSWFWVIGMIKNGNTTLVYGVGIVVRIWVDVDLFDRKTLDTSVASLHRIDADPAPYPPPIPVYLTNPPVVNAPQLVKPRVDLADPQRLPEKSKLGEPTH